MSGSPLGRRQVDDLKKARCLEFARGFSASSGPSSLLQDGNDGFQLVGNAFPIDPVPQNIALQTCIC